ncbi:MAG: hypothetical protein ACKVS8_10320 [Phycisphaerales bacterium]
MSMDEAELSLLLELTQVPTAAGREQGVIAFISGWAAARPEVRLSRDRAGNITLGFVPGEQKRSAKGRSKAGKAPPVRPLYITAHMDHPAFVVERVLAPETVEVSFRGGVSDVFFTDAPITLHTSAGTLAATLTGECGSSALGKHYTVEVDEGGGNAAAAEAVRPGDIGTWRLPAAHVDEAGLLHTPACDDLAALAAALCAMDRMRAVRASGGKGAAAAFEHVRLLFTRAEEIGFIGAIAAVRLKTIPKTAVVIALENSRAFAESPIGGGPIVRVGDRLSIFTPWVTAACAARAEEVFGGASTPTAAQTAAAAAKRPWQRKLMAGGACEASVFCHAGYDATCICLPLGNYHNMTNLEMHQAGTYDAAKMGPARCGPETIHTKDFLGLVDLLVALGERLPRPEEQSFGKRLEKLYKEKGFVLTGQRPGPRGAKNQA